MRSKRAQLDKGFTQATLAKRLRISGVHLASLESPDNAKHHRSPSLAQLQT